MISAWKASAFVLSEYEVRLRDENKGSASECICQSTPNGGVAQLGEHLPCKQGVMGSNPIISTRVDTAEKINGLVAQLVRAPA